MHNSMRILNTFSKIQIALKTPTAENAEIQTTSKVFSAWEMCKVLHFQFQEIKPQTKRSQSTFMENNILSLCWVRYTTAVCLLDDYFQCENS